MLLTSLTSAELVTSVELVTSPELVTSVELSNSVDKHVTLPVFDDSIFGAEVTIVESCIIGSVSNTVVFVGVIVDVTAFASDIFLDVIEDSLPVVIDIG